MKRCNRALLLASVIVIFGVTCEAQSRINLVNGRRAVSDQVTFVVEVGSLKRNPPYATAPEHMQLYVTFGDRPATGVVYLDGKAMTRFDESMQFLTNPVDISYGRHNITLKFAGPGVVTTFMVMIQGGVAREILEGDSTAPTHSTGFEHRIAELERKVNDLEAQIVTLKKKPLVN